MIQRYLDTRSPLSPERRLIYIAEMRMYIKEFGKRDGNRWVIADHLRVAVMSHAYRYATIKGKYPTIKGKYL